MNRRRAILVLSAGALLTVAGAQASPSPSELPEPPGNPPPRPPLPTWDEVESGHPEGATNPPSPQLLVSPKGRCFKKWTDPRRASPDRVEPKCDDDADACGTEIVCPQPRAETLLKAYNEPEISNPPPPDMNPPPRKRRKKE